MQAKRLYFIDAVRAFAILMMLQGHFVDTLLEPVYKDESYSAYNIWYYFRGITAPTFFTISGLIFTYLLIKAKEKGQEKLRIKKGLNRGLMLIGIGYLLRIPLLQWLIGDFNTYWLVIDVLQIIGLSLIFIIGFYCICFKLTSLFSAVMLGLGCFIFVTEPLYRTLALTNLPLFISNYISKADGSVFTILPWFGYMAFGAFLATLFYQHLEKQRFKPITVLSFFLVGYLLVFWSSTTLRWLTEVTSFDIFLRSANYNYLFTRLGNVFIYFGTFYGLERFIKVPLILKIGQKTLSIYVIHFIIIYGSFTGFGLNRIIGKTLNPWEAVFGALTFLIVVCFISFYYVKTNKFIYSHLRRLLDRLKRNHHPNRQKS